MIKALKLLQEGSGDVTDETCAYAGVWCVVHFYLPPEPISVSTEVRVRL